MDKNTYHTEFVQLSTGTVLKKVDMIMPIYKEQRIEVDDVLYYVVTTQLWIDDNNYKLQVLLGR